MFRDERNSAPRGWAVLVLTFALAYVLAENAWLRGLVYGKDDR